ncbi:MAG: Gfo/Idh/MocA family oxidoreductase [Rhizobiaceae bacterium]|nr:Gfo/Idh/MocA family oxidoreductase [Rhizobiaceae bacterium]
MSGELKVAVVGLGYFAEFHLDAWTELKGSRLVALSDFSAERRAWANEKYGLIATDDAADVMASDPDIIDIVTPPPSHFDLIKKLAAKDKIIICQKPFCLSVKQAEEAIALANERGCRIFIHENFRFQPWYRTIKTFIDEGGLGEIYQSRYYLRPGDGRGPDAYLSRQPAFQAMPRLLIHETGVHFIDLFRWMSGEISNVYADIRKLNPVIAGEDCGIVIMNHENGSQSIIDGNRLSDHPTDNLRRTMGVMQIEGEKGTIDLNGLGEITFRPFGSTISKNIPISLEMDRNAFGGGCVKALCKHILLAANGEGEFENEAHDYLAVIKASEATYQSAEQARRVDL